MSNFPDGQPYVKDGIVYFPDGTTKPYEPRYSHESVEYSDGYYHTVFAPGGMKLCDCLTEEKAVELCELLNLDRIIIPRTKQQAEAMILVAEAFLKSNRHG